MKPARVVTSRELNRALLARQLLLERSALPITEALEQVGGLQTQYAPSGYVGLWTRLADFPRDALTKELETKRVVQATLMRTTIHMVSARDYPLLAAAVRRARRDWYLKVQGGRFPQSEVENASARVRDLLAGGPRRREGIVKELGLSNQLWYGVGLWVDLVRVPPSGTWERRRADLYWTADAWLGPSTATEEDGIRRLIQRYLSGFGPARIKDIAGWSGLSRDALSAAIANMKLVRYGDEEGGELLDLPGAELPDPSAPAPVRFLPTWDASLLAHARQAEVLAEVYRPRVFDTKTPHSVGTFLVGGAVAGTWRLERNRVVTEPFAALSRSAKGQVDEEAERLTSFHA
jgi:hypothetical protein